MSGHCCCCTLGLAQRPCSIFQRPCHQGRHCTCSITHAHNVHVQPHGQPLHPFEVQQQRLPTPWRGPQVDKSTASKNKTHSDETDPSQRLLCCVVSHRFIMEGIMCDIIRFTCLVVVLFIVFLLSCQFDSVPSSRSTLRVGLQQTSQVVWTATKSRPATPSLQYGTGTVRTSGLMSTENTHPI